MPNPFFNGPRSNSSNTKTNATGFKTNNLAEIYKILTTANDPQRVFRNIAKNNPNMAPIVELLNKGISPEDIFNTMCQQRGIDPQQFINTIKR